MNYEYLDDFDIEFADPGGRSALRAATTTHCPFCKKRISRQNKFCKHCSTQLNPRIFPCPNCGTKNVLTPKDVALGYQCNRCADIAEGLEC